MELLHNLIEDTQAELFTIGQRLHFVIVCLTMRVMVGDNMEVHDATYKYWRYLTGNSVIDRILYNSISSDLWSHMKGKYVEVSSVLLFLLYMSINVRSLSSNVRSDILTCVLTEKR